ncbi:MAG TPA: hypothetical protein VME63_02340 [Dyella sp.]|uniref:hypothetical protein n=1 Tax=Dyella sp. TaxID=1869338 RepID=UPI002CEF4F39|nr:hypothetical protein [Dyella sp.]HTV84213.1 hypothetical protein [Dyella sp.]
MRSLSSFYCNLITGLALAMFCVAGIVMSVDNFISDWNEPHRSLAFLVWCGGAILSCATFVSALATVVLVFGTVALVLGKTLIKEITAVWTAP